MIRFLRSHEEWVLAGAGIALAGLILASVVWGITLVSRTVGAAANSRSGEDTKIQFDLEQASKLDFRGIK